MTAANQSDTKKPTAAERRAAAVVSDLKGQGRRSSVAQECQDSLAEVLQVALTGLLHPNNAGRALLTLQSRFPATCGDIVRTL